MFPVTCPFCRKQHGELVELAICWWNHLPSRQLHPDGVVRACFCGKWAGRKPLPVAEHLHMPGSLVSHLKITGVESHIAAIAVEKWKKIGKQPARGFCTSASTTANTATSSVVRNNSGMASTMSPQPAQWNPVTKPKGK